MISIIFSFHGMPPNSLSLLPHSVQCGEHDYLVCLDASGTTRSWPHEPLFVPLPIVDLVQIV